MKAFVAVRLALRGHFKLAQLATRLDCRKAEAQGYLSWLWGSVMEQKPGGTVPNWGAVEVSHYADWGGDPETFYAALLDIGWILEVEGGVRMNDWEEWCNMHAAQAAPDDMRAKWREQKRAQRARRKAVSADSPRTSADMSPEKRGEENIGAPPPSQLQIVSGAQQPEAAAEKRAPLRVDLPARAELGVPQVIETVLAFGLSPQMQEPTRKRLHALCPVTRDELDSAVHAARVTRRGGAPPNLGLIVSKMEFARQDAAAALEAGGEQATGTAGGYVHRLSHKDSAMAESRDIYREMRARGDV